MAATRSPNSCSSSSADAIWSLSACCSRVWLTRAAAKQLSNLVQAERTDPHVHPAQVVLVVERPLMQPGEYLMVALAPATHASLEPNNNQLVAVELPRIRQQHSRITNMVWALHIKIQCICVRTHVVLTSALCVTVDHMPATKRNSDSISWRRYSSLMNCTSKLVPDVAFFHAVHAFKWFADSSKTLL